MMFYSTQRYKFDYEGKNWMIQVWKGQYGITSGAEIGVYTKSPKNPVEFYACASDEDCLKMSFDLYKKGELFFHREDESHWWLTGFAPLTATSASDFEMRASITCKSEEMAKAFAGDLRITAMSSVRTIGSTAQSSDSIGTNNQINRVAAASFGLRRLFAI